MQFRKRINLGLVEGTLNYRSKLWKSLSASLFQPITGLSVYQDSTRTTLASVGDAVGALNSLTNSDVTTQATTSFKPQLLQSGAGNNYLALDGVNDSLPVTIPDGAWVADMTSINYLTNGNTATNNTIVDYLGNTITLKAGEIGWNNARRVENIFTNFKGRSASLAAGVTYIKNNATDRFGRANSAHTIIYTSGAPSAVRFTVTADFNYDIGRKYRILADFRSNTGDYTFTLGTNATGTVSITATTNWRTFITNEIVATVLALELIQIRDTNLAAAFNIEIANVMLVDVTDSPLVIPDFTDGERVHNAGVVGVKYFDTLPANTVSNNIVTETMGAKLTTPPTIKISAGDGLAISPKYTSRTIVDYLGNTVTLKAGEIGWNGARRVDNLFTNSEFEGGLSTYTTLDVSLTAISGFNQGVLFPDNSTYRYSYKQISTVVGRKYCFSAFVEIATAPAFGNTSTSDFQLVIPGMGTSFTPTSLELITDGLYRLHVVFVANATSGFFGFAKYAGSLSRSFKVSGYQFVDITGIAANDYYPEYVRSNAVHNAGVAGVKYFNSDIYKQPLLSPITPNTTGVFTALAYSPTLRTTITDYLGNTITLKAGEIGWNNARRVENLLPACRNWATLNGGQLQFASATSSNVAFTSTNGYISKSTSHVFSIGDVVCARIAVKTSDSRTGVCIRFIPSTSGGASAVNVALTDQWVTYYLTRTMTVAESMSIRLDNRTAAGASAQNSTIVGSIDVDFCGVYLISTALAQTPPEFIDSDLVYNAGIAGVKYFDTMPANTVSNNVVTDVVGANLPGSIISVTGSPTTPAQSDRDKIDAYVQNQGVKL